MKKILNSLFTIGIIIGCATSAHSQIFLDGESRDWYGYPALINAPDNQEGMFPGEVGAVVTDIVDIKTVKATVIENVLFAYLEFWAGPAWPNNAYKNDHEGTMYPESRGYYHLLLDIDNDVTTGWSTDWYEGRHTILGHYISQGSGYEPIGVEIMTEWGARTNDDWKIENEGADPIRNLDYWAADYEEYDGVNDLGSDYVIFNMPVPNPDSARMMQWQGSLIINSSDDSLLVSDGRTTYWGGHAWGYNFLEFGLELAPFQEYFLHKDGRLVLQPGDVIGICGMTETPIDNWGVDMTSRGELVISGSVGVAEEKSTGIIERYNLANNYPNPFNPSTTIDYTLPRPEHVRITIYDMLGRQVKTLIDANQQAGRFQTVWNGTDAGNIPVAAGVYFYRMQAGDFVQVNKLLLVK